MKFKLFKEIIRRCSTSTTSRKPKCWYMMGTAEKDGLIKNNIKKLPSDDLISTQNFYFAQYVSEAAADIEGCEFSATAKRFTEFCNYNGLDREQYCVWWMLAAYQLFQEHAVNTKHNIKQVCMLGWAFEAISTSLLIQDDFMDNGRNRWKKECWYKKPEIGSSMIIDVNLLRMSAFRTLKRYFRQERYYNSLINALTDMVKSPPIGQIIDINIQNTFQKNRNLKCFTLKNYHSMCFYKNYMPVVRDITLAILIVFNAQEEYNKYEYIFRKLALHCQIDNDVRDCFNNYENFGRYGSDIREEHALLRCALCQDKVEAVLTTWFTMSSDNGLQCWWPSQTKNFHSLLKNKELPVDHENWFREPCHIIKYCATLLDGKLEDLKMTEIRQAKKSTEGFENPNPIFPA